MELSAARELFAGARVARLATVRPGGRPHLVPIVFAMDGDVIVTAVDDAKAKRTRALTRLANIAAEPRVSVLADHFDEDWSQLWWVRADGVAVVVDRDADAIALLADRYRQYREQLPPGPVIRIQVDRWTGWAAE
ncbi:MAG TPA: TIGR03668 family PPOX class F420-dependent oxidoreductase [Jatrophihabitantaceae bacterium]|nr:TIGR03668 family PPOX class F420-dependent oxidoreductase [Jatrophihabitantaceae bacterium]